MVKTLWIDADACPGAVRDMVLRASSRHALVFHTTFVANKPLLLPVSDHLSFVQVGAGPDVVDGYIIQHSNPGDMVISQDIPLAGELVPKGVIVISPYGTLFDPNNIAERLGMRNFLTDLRDSGTITGGPKAFGEKEKRQFAGVFDRELTRWIK